MPSAGCSAGACPATCRAAGSGRSRRSRRSAPPAGCPALAHFGEAPARVDVVRELAEAGLGGLEVYYRSFDSATVFAVGEVAAALGLVATGGSDYHGDTGPYAECARRACGSRPRSARPWSAALSVAVKRRVGLGLVLHERRAQLDRRLAARPRPQVECLDEDAEAHRRVDVRLVDVEPEPVGDQRHADEQQERQREHLDRRMVVDEPRQRSRRDEHHADGDDDGRRS